MRPLHIARPLRAAGAAAIADAVVEVHALPIDRAAAFDRDVLRIGGVEQREVSVARRNALAGRIILNLSAAENATLRRQMQCDVAFQLHRAAKKIAGRHEHDAAAIVVGGIDGRLNGRRVERGPIPFRAKIANVVDRKPAGFRIGWRSGILGRRRRSQ